MGNSWNAPLFQRCLSSILANSPENLRNIQEKKGIESGVREKRRPPRLGGISGEIIQKKIGTMSPELHSGYDEKAKRIKNNLRFPKISPICITRVHRYKS
jgi:hypothetical protein